MAARWKLYEVSRPGAPGNDLIATDYGTGAFWRTPVDEPIYEGGQTYRDVFGHTLSRQFLGSGRDYIITVKLPGGCGFFVTDHQAPGSEDGWLVQGDLPMITVTPSINTLGCYHGWITGGALTEDIEGRKYQHGG